MDINNVIFLLFFLNSLTQFFSIPLYNQMLLDFTKASYRLYCQKRVAILKQKKIIKIYVLNIPKYSFIVLYSDNKRKITCYFLFWYLNDTEK
jgi:hypothetical protein